MRVRHVPWRLGSWRSVLEPVCHRLSFLAPAAGRLHDPVGIVPVSTATMCARLEYVLVYCRANSDFRRLVSASVQPFGSVRASHASM
jgi:hypothetical protein